jgi:hypothetical protein
MRVYDRMQPAVDLLFEHPRSRQSCTAVILDAFGSRFSLGVDFSDDILNLFVGFRHHLPRQQPRRAPRHAIAPSVRCTAVITAIAAHRGAQARLLFGVGRPYSGTFIPQKLPKNR